jgi:hypothetical protein
VTTLVCCPTRGRPELAAAFADNVLRTSGATVAFYIDHDQVDIYRDLIEHRNRSILVKVGPPIGSAQAYNSLYHSYSRFDIYGMCADDTEFSPQGWDRYLEDIVAEFPNGIGVAATHNNSHIQFPFVTKRWIDLVGWVPPDFKHYAIDGVLQLLGEDTHLVWLDPAQLALEHKDARTDSSIGNDAVTFMLWAVTQKRFATEILREAMIAA